MCVVPAIIPESGEHVQTSLGRLGGVSERVQIDLVDGVYAGKASWPWSHNVPFETFAALLSTISHEYEVEVDLMVREPERYMHALVEAGAHRVVIHVGSTMKLADILHLYHSSIQIGLAFTNDTPREELAHYADSIDFVQCMGITQVGAQGLPFDERTLATIADIRAQYPTLEISVDGHVNTFTLPMLKHAGATRFVVGSAIFGTDDPISSYKKMVEIARA